MGTLTPDERRRVFLARQQATQRRLARLTAAVAVTESERRHRRLTAILKAAVIAALLSTGWFALDVVEFHLPASRAEALPRV